MTTKRRTLVEGSSNLKSRNTRSQIGHQAARADAFLAGQVGDAPQAVVLEEDFDAVGGEGLFVLTDDAALGAFSGW